MKSTILVAAACCMLGMPTLANAQSAAPFVTNPCVEPGQSALQWATGSGQQIVSLIHGTYLMDEAQGSFEGGEDPNRRDAIYYFDPQNRLRGVDEHISPSGYIYGSEIWSWEGEQGMALRAVLCDYQADKVVMAELKLDPDIGSQLRIDQTVDWDHNYSSTAIRLKGNAFPNSVADWSGVSLETGSGKSGSLQSMTVVAYVTLHGEGSLDPAGTLGTFWSGVRQEDNMFGTWLTGVSEPYEDPFHDDRMLYNITISGYDWGDEISFVQVARDPRTLVEGHFGIGRDTFTFIPNSTLGSDQFPIEIVLLHPPFLKPDFPGQVIRAGESFAPIDLNELIVDPTGQKIDFRVTGARGIYTEIDSLNFLHLTYRSDWSGADRITLEATHSTRETTLREATFAVIDKSMRYPFWSNPFPGTFQHRMQVIAAFEEESGVTLDDFPVAGAFENSLFRGTSTAVNYNGQVRMIVDVYSDNPGADIELLGYTVEHDNFVSALVQIPFEPGATIGSFQDPVRFGFIATDVEGEDEGLPEHVSIQATYPNPARSSVNLHYNLPQASPVNVWFTDTLGRRQDVFSSTLQPAGPSHHMLNVTSMASGLYWVTVESDLGLVTKPLVVIGE